MALAPRVRGKSNTVWPTGRLRDRPPPLPSVSEEMPPASRGESPNPPGGDAALVHDFDALVALHHKSLFNFIYQWIGDYEEASDLTQETFVSAYKAREQFRGDSKVFTWLYRIAHNHCKNRFKQRDRQREMEGVSLDAGAAPEGGEGEAREAVTRDVADWSFSPARALEQKELRALIDQAVNGLASDYKEILLLREVQEMSYSDIAAVTGLTLEAVKTRLNRARAMVRRRVEPYYRA